MSKQVVKKDSTQALTITDDQATFSDQQVAALSSLGMKNVSPPDLAIFLHQCQRTGLDPFARQIYMISRKTKQREGDEWVWADRQTIQTGIDGARLIARRAVAASGETYSTDGPYWCGTDGKWVDVWLSSGPPAAAKYTVIRAGGKFVGVARTSAYMATYKDYQGRTVPTGLWSKMPDVMVAKCAEMLALRKAFPQDLSGIYTAEEMQQADNPADYAPTGTETETEAEGSNSQARQERKKHRQKVNYSMRNSEEQQILDAIRDLVQQYGISLATIAQGVKWASDRKATNIEALNEQELSKLLKALKEKVGA